MSIENSAQQREHIWSAEVNIPLGASTDEGTWTRLCTRLECGIAELSYRTNPQSCTGHDGLRVNTLSSPMQIGMYPHRS
ncbi:hypothetical protein KIPE111705_05560 [Kibdelosporangium persicum]